MGNASTEKRRFTTELPEELALRLDAICETTLRSRPAEIQLAVKAWVEQRESEVQEAA